MKKEFEFKYKLPAARVPEILGILERSFLAQEDYPESYVWNVYFDTLDLSSYYETIFSDYIKTKYRFRWYTDINDGCLSQNSYVEIKKRYGANRDKFRREADKELYLELVNRPLTDPMWSLVNFHELGNGLDPQVRFPIHKSKYKRKRFVSLDGKIRLNLDYDLSIEEINTQILHDTFRRSSTQIDYCVFEIKSVRNLTPNELFLFPHLEVFKNPFSKYSFLVNKCHSAFRWGDINERI